jgi:tellurite resistance protein TerC
MMLHHHVDISNVLSLGVILMFLAIGMAASAWSNKRAAAKPLIDDERKGK